MTRKYQMWIDEEILKKTKVIGAISELSVSRIIQIALKQALNIPLKPREQIDYELIKDLSEKSDRPA